MLVSGSAGGAWAKTCHVGDDAQFFSGSDSTKQGASPYRTEDYGKSRLWAGMSEHQKQWKIAHIIGRNSSGVNSGWWGMGRRCWLPTIPRGEYHFKQREFRTMDTKWHKWGTSLPPAKRHFLCDQNAWCKWQKPQSLPSSHWPRRKSTQGLRQRCGCPTLPWLAAIGTSSWSKPQSNLDLVSSFDTSRSNKST